MSWFEFIVILLATLALAFVQLLGWLGCFYAGWQMVFLYGPTLESGSGYTLAWMAGLNCLVLLGIYWLKCSLYWFDRVAYFRAWKDEYDRAYRRGAAGFYGRGGGFG